MDAAIPSVSQTAAPYFCTAGFQPALLFIPRARPAHPLHHFRNLQHGVHLRANALQLPFLLQPLHKLPQVRVRHCSLLSRRTLPRTSTHSPRCPASLPQARECLPFDFLRPAPSFSCSPIGPCRARLPRRAALLSEHDKSRGITSIQSHLEPQSFQADTNCLRLTINAASRPLFRFDPYFRTL